MAFMRAGIVLLLVSAFGIGCHFAEDELEAPSVEDSSMPRGAAEEPPATGDAETASRSGPSFAAKVAAHTEAARAKAAEREAAEAPRFEIDESLSEEERAVEAKRLFRDGLEAFERGDYERAATEFEHAYAYTPHLHALAYNAARAHDLGGDCCRARELYEAFVEHEDSDQGERARARLDTLSCDDC